MAPDEECQHEMFVLIGWERRALAVPLAQLEGVAVDEQTAATPLLGSLAYRRALNRLGSGLRSWVSYRGGGRADLYVLGRHRPAE
jgi:Calcium binding